MNREVNRYRRAVQKAGHFQSAPFLHTTFSPTFGSAFRKPKDALRPTDSALYDPSPNRSSLRLLSEPSWHFAKPFFAGGVRPVFLCRIGPSEPFHRGKVRLEKSCDRGAERMSSRRRGHPTKTAKGPPAETRRPVEHRVGHGGKTTVTPDGFTPSEALSVVTIPRAPCRTPSGFFKPGQERDASAFRQVCVLRERSLERDGKAPRRCPPRTVGKKSHR